MCEFQLVSDAKLDSVLGISPANDHSKSLGWRQLQATAKNVSAVRFAAVLDPWHKGNLKVTLQPDGPDKATLTVTGNNINDTWNWQAATKKFEAATLHGARPNNAFNITINAKDVPPSP
jgi:hypothetical protein